MYLKRVKGGESLTKQLATISNEVSKASVHTKLGGTAGY
ncbi:hypothetical protein ACUXJP_000151 [Staphylococcus cohnii]|uniref:Uncharacterized protein n=1 Tax=Staphylococcus cohnii subsp. cohnii TaxID=74704 RepID=A0A0M2NV63_STACC|nr:hypothetical protein UF66_0658 [Staphylococcus cohnii subsp. cohnii]